MTDIKIYRLITGETVIGKDDGEEIKDAYMMRLVQKSETEVQTIMTPYFAPLSDKKVNIKLSSVLTSVEVNEEISQKYQQVTSNIIIPNSNSISKLPPTLRRAK
jgi:hypothetical protein